MPVQSDPTNSALLGWLHSGTRGEAVQHASCYPFVIVSLFTAHKSHANAPPPCVATNVVYKRQGENSAIESVRGRLDYTPCKLQLDAPFSFSVCVLSARRWKERTPRT